MESIWTNRDKQIRQVFVYLSFGQVLFFLWFIRIIIRIVEKIKEKY